MTALIIVLGLVWVFSSMATFGYLTRWDDERRTRTRIARQWAHDLEDDNEHGTIR